MVRSAHLENAFLRVGISSDRGGWRLLDKRAGVTWGAPEGAARSLWSPERARYSQSARGQVLECRSWAGKIGVAVSIRLGQGPKGHAPALS